MLSTLVGKGEHFGDLINVHAKAGHDWVLKWVLRRILQRLQSVAATCKGRHTEHIRNTSQRDSRAL
jgi:hypothetical protein